MNTDANFEVDAYGRLGLTVALAEQLERVSSILEEFLGTHVYESEDEVWASPEAQELAYARALIYWSEGGPQPSTTVLH